MNDTLQANVSFIQMRNLTQYLILIWASFFFFFFFPFCRFRVSYVFAIARPLARASFLPFTFLRAQGRRWRLDLAKHRLD